MANHDYNIANQTAPNFRADLNNALLAIVSTNSGSSAPSTTFANMLWYDTTNNKLMMRNEADSAWITVFESDQTNNRINIITDDIQAATSGGTDVNNSSGTKILSLTVPTQSTAETGTEETQVMTPLRTKQSVQANAITSVVGGTNISVSTSSGAATVNNSISGGSGLTLSGSTMSLTSIGGVTSVGSFILGVRDATGAVSAGDTRAGSDLHYAGIDHPLNNGYTENNARITSTGTTVGSGTWRAHFINPYNRYSWGIWQRIS